MILITQERMTLSSVHYSLISKSNDDINIIIARCSVTRDPPCIIILSNLFKFNVKYFLAIKFDEVDIRQ